MLCSGGKILLLKYLSLSNFDKLWIQFKLSMEERKLFARSLKTVDGDNIKNISYKEMQGLVDEVMKSTNTYFSKKKYFDNRLPACVSKIIVGNGNDIAIVDDELSSHLKVVLEELVRQELKGTTNA
ncbi:hypothetical protein ACJJIQ_14510 [Microbulbifer sp. ANSA003]|uniref:hypothetical protein n=1 Tax=Microbulbifer sp. ANSA003 TaxID=3243360 RepID=UPI004041F4E4